PRNTPPRHPLQPERGRTGVGRGPAGRKTRPVSQKTADLVVTLRWRSQMPDSINTANFKVTTGPLPASRKIYVPGQRHADLAVPMREIDLEKSSGEKPVRVYDPSGLYTDPAHVIDIYRGLPTLRRRWIEARGDVEAYAGREVRPEDNGLKGGETSAVAMFDRGGRQVLRGKPGKAVTQLAYARAGIVTPEMEFISIRENLG